MNRYPIWKYAILVIALLLGTVFTLPNFFGEAPAVQVSSGKATVKVDNTTLQRVEEALKTAGLNPQTLALDGASIRARFDTTDNQIKAKDAMDLRGGVHFMLQVDMAAALQQRADGIAGDLRTALREKGVRHGGISRNGQTIELRARDAQTMEAIKA
jgi:preprotein translocase subunit SecD